MVAGPVSTWTVDVQEQLGRKGVANFRVRPLSHLGRYPASQLSVGSDQLFSHEGLLFSCTLNRMVTQFGRTEADQPAFELENWTLPEVRLFASMYLACGPYLAVHPYPLPPSQDLFAKSADVIRVDERLTARIASQTRSGDNHLMRGNCGLVPGNFGDYTFVGCEAEDARRLDLLWAKIDLSNPTLMRGLLCLLKSGMLHTHFQFSDASLSAVHIALDAAHSLALSEVRSSGAVNPSSHDAGRWIEEVLGYAPTGLRFLEDWHGDRVRNFHPESRYGAEAIPSFCVDDIYDLTRHLKDIFYFLITREVYRETVEEREKWGREG